MAASLSLCITTALLSLMPLITGCSPDNDKYSSEEHLYKMLDAAIDSSSHYEKKKEKRIAELKRLLKNTKDYRTSYRLTNSLIGEYNAYKADSCLFYISRNLKNPIVNTDRRYRNDLLLKRADIYAHAGLFSDAISTMALINVDSLDLSQKNFYYSNYCSLYQYMLEYNLDIDNEMVAEYDSLRRGYTDSVKRLTKTNTFNYYTYVVPELARRGQHEEAIRILSDYCRKFKSGTREYSILTSILADVYHTSGNEEEFRRHLAMSAISDAQAAVKENMSFRALAGSMFDKGDIVRANRYLKKSIADANFFSARMRNAQSSKMLPIIDEAYSARQQEMACRLKILIVIVSMLALGVIAALIYIRVQYQRLKRANAVVADTNTRLSHLSEQLKRANADLLNSNSTLMESNLIKEQYTGLFMEYCASAISTLQKYNQSLKVLAASGGSKEALLKKLDSPEFIYAAIHEFYANFDEAILKIYPDFPDKVNLLMKDDGKIIVKPDEILNTELRLLALIRLGMTDSEKIARFLRCSIATVYTYRSRLKKRALNPATFEADVVAII